MQKYSKERKTEKNTEEKEEKGKEKKRKGKIKGKRKRKHFKIYITTKHHKRLKKYALNLSCCILNFHCFKLL